MSGTTEDAAATSSFYFEGVEKSLEIDFTPEKGPVRGCREISRAALDGICSAAVCVIMDSMSNDHLDAYVLSESSLFVYPRKIILKTCGTTTPLLAIEPILAATSALGMTVEWVAYTHKDYIRPAVQIYPHRSFEDELTLLKRFFPKGDSFALGPTNADHWLVFVADYLDRDTKLEVDRTLSMCMFGIDESVARLFVRDKARFPKDSDVTAASGIDMLLPGSQTQEFCFDPCGYSVNGLLYESYWTIHITPESAFSYASFETNIRMPQYNSLVRSVLSIFRPQKWSMCLMADSTAIKGLKDVPFEHLITLPIVESRSRAIMGPIVVLPAKNAPSSSSSSSSSSLSGLSGSYTTAATAVAVTKALPVETSPLNVETEATGGGGGAGAMPGQSPTDGRGNQSPTLFAPPSPEKTTTTAVDGGHGNSAAFPTSAEGEETTEAPPVNLLTEALLSKGVSIQGSNNSLSSSASSASSSPTLGLEGSGASSNSSSSSSASGKSRKAPHQNASYLMTTRSSTEFVGEYSGTVGNFVRVQLAPGGRPVVETVAKAAGEILAFPRAKYATQRALESKLRLRTDSV